MILVVDANVAVKWFVQQPGSDHARRVQAHKDPLIAPALLVAETASGLWQHVRRGDVPVSQARVALVGLPKWFDELVEDLSLVSRAIDLAADLNYSPYDCIYLALCLLAPRHL
jgi:predicted nucleic acid-binding protein